MSYCRWSSDDFKSDVYVYESDMGFMIHVAGGKHDPYPTDLPAPMRLTPDNVPEWLQRNEQVREILDNTPLVAITLPYAGETFTEDSPGACRERLLQLRNLGY